MYITRIKFIQLKNRLKSNDFKLITEACSGLFSKLKPELIFEYIYENSLKNDNLK